MSNVSPALRDDPDSPSASPLLNSSGQSAISCSGSPEAVGGRSPVAALESRRGHLSTMTPRYDYRYTFYDLQ